ncbi:MAG: hypothetical protein J5586_04245 [Clostridia bacterium]|nr:hypothetical protein [Clostridia bacterium]
MKSLKTIQVLAKIGKVLSKIVQIFCIVGLVLCLLGLGSWILLQNADLGNIDPQLVQLDKEVTYEYVIATMICGIIALVAEIVVSTLAYRYFKHELEEGTPFRFKLADELKRLGVVTIVLSVAAFLICDIGWRIAYNYVPAVGKFPFESAGYSQVGMGIAMLIVAVICRCATEKIGETDGALTEENA